MCMSANANWFSVSVPQNCCGDPHNGLPSKKCSCSCKQSRMVSKIVHKCESQKHSITVQFVPGPGTAAELVKNMCLQISLCW